MSRKQFSSPRSRQAGIGLGYLLIIIVLLVAIGTAAMRFSSDSTPSTSAQQAQLDAGTLANQVGTQRGNLTMLSTGTTSAWDVFGPTDTNPKHMTLASGTSGAITAISGLDANRQISQPPRGNSAALTWTYSVPSSSTAPILMFTQLDVPAAVCKQFNMAAQGLTGSSAELVDSDLAAAGLPSGTPTTGVVAASVGTTVESAALSKGDGCFVATAGAAVGRVVARLR